MSGKAASVSETAPESWLKANFQANGNVLLVQIFFPFTEHIADTIDHTVTVLLAIEKNPQQSLLLNLEQHPRWSNDSGRRASDPTGVICPFGSFRCPEGKCIPSLWVCNYQKDCEKGEDEFQSCPPPECEPGQLTCRQYIWNKTYCFPPHYRCDMTVDCIDGSDETECSKYTIV
nr:unnamed protein product [Callosobruchus analis]